jgi:serine/threonine protein kinase
VNPQPPATVVNPSGDERLVAALSEYLAAIEAGNPIPRAAFLARHADIAEILDPALAALQFVQEAAPRLHLDASQQTPSSAPQALGDFHILREVGRGGMGVVYEAQQLSLGRRVALKVLPLAATLDPRQLQRFKNEAQAAAALHHPSIVPVFAVGCERGVHFYAMQFIDGHNLANLIADLRQRADLGQGTPAQTDGTRNVASGTTLVSEALHSPGYFRAVAALGKQAAEALDHAHEMGVVHRDIKPSNLLLDRAGRLWITDFGLVQLATADGLTLSGDLVGTIRYMSPEQARGDRRVLVDHRTDVYSLGATLYELATLRPVREGQDRQELLRHILEAEPTSPRRHDPRVPLDLETILLKALATEPAERYASAKELADDLARFLNEEPVRARRPGLTERVGRWVRRHRGLVVATFVLLLLAVAGLATSTALIWAAGQAKDQALHDKEKALERMYFGTDAGWDAVENMFTKVAFYWLALDSTQDVLQRHFLGRAMDYYQKYADLFGDDPQMARRVAKAEQRVTVIAFALGDKDTSFAASQRALDRLAPLVEANPADEDLTILLVQTWQYRSRYLADQHRFVEALAASEAGEKVMARRLADRPEGTSLAIMYAILRENQGRIVAAMGRGAEAHRAYEQALDLLRPALLLERPPVEAFNTLGRAWAGRAAEFRKEHQFAEAEQAYLQALASYAGMAGRGPASGIQSALYHAQMELGELYRDWRRDAQGALAYRAALDIAAAQARESPRTVEYQRRVRMAANACATLLFDVDPTAADACYKQAIEAGEAALALAQAADKGAVGFRVELAGALLSRILLLTQLHRHAEGEALARRHLKLRQQICDARPEEVQHLYFLAVAYNRLGASSLGLDRRAEATTAYQEALRLLDQLPAERRELPEGRTETAHATGQLADCLTLAAQYEKACPNYERAVALRRTLIKDQPERTDYRLQLGTKLSNWAGALRMIDRDDEAAKTVDEAIAVLQSLAEKAPGEASHHGELAGALSERGRLRLDVKPADVAEGRRNAEAALADLTRAAEVGQVALRMAPTNGLYRMRLRQAYERQAEALTRLGRPEDAARARMEAARFRGPAPPPKP